MAEINWPDGYFGCVAHRCTLSVDACKKRHISAVEGGYVASQRYSRLSLDQECRTCEHGASLCATKVPEKRRVSHGERAPEKIGDICGGYEVVSKRYRENGVTRISHLDVKCLSCGTTKSIQASAFKLNKRGCAGCTRRNQQAVRGKKRICARRAA